MVRSLLDDSSSEDGAKIIIRKDEQNDIYICILNADGKMSETVRFCGPGGGSRYPGLAGKIDKIIFKDD